MSAGLSPRKPSTGYSPKVIAAVLGGFALVVVIVANTSTTEDPELERARAGMERTARVAEQERAKQAARRPASPAPPAEDANTRTLAQDLLLNATGSRKLTAISEAWGLIPKVVGDKIAKAGELCANQGHARIPSHQGAVDFLYTFQADGSTKDQDIESMLSTYILMGCPVD